MDISEMMEYLVLEPINLGTWAKTIEQKAAQEPSQRQYHSSIVHKTSLYIYGGVPEDQTEDHANEQRTIYRYNTSTKGWSKSITNFLNNNSFSYIYSHSTIIYNNMMYLFGGKNYKTNEYLNGLWCLNLESFNWKRQELKGYSPSLRENASFVLHQRNMIILYGGRYANNNLNDLHIYKIQNKIWIQIDQSSYDLKISCRLRPALASQGDYLYLFGGERMIADQDKTVNLLLDDFYQLKFISRPMNTKPDIWIKEIITNTKPAKKVANFVSLNEKYLMLWGGQNYYNGKITSELGFWVYSIQDVNWNWIKIKGNIERALKIGYSINICNDKCYIFGRNRETDVPSHKKVDSGLMVLNLDNKEIEQKLSQAKYKPKISQEGHLNCNECDQHKKSILKSKFADFIILKQSLGDRIEYVYSAFGLLVDNSLILKAKECRIIFHYTNKQKYCLIQDNGVAQTLWDTHSDFINDLMVFRTYVEENIDQLEQIKQEDISKINFMKEEVSKPTPVIHPSIVPNTALNPAAMTKETKEQKEQKQKELRQKEQEKELRRRKQQAKRAHRRRIEDRKQFSRNIKLGCLRIGDKLIYINRFGQNNENRRVFVIEKYESNKAHQYTYRTYYYVLENNNLIDSSMDVAKKYIDQEYKMYLKISNERKEEGSNFVFITNLKEIVNDSGQVEAELKENAKHSDVFCCEKRVIEGLEDAAFLQSIDISLKSYLTLLYLKCDEMKISLAISDNKLMEINNLQFFQKIDQLAKSQRIIDLEVALDLSNCNIIQVYYNKSNSNRSREMNRKVSSNGFLNGVLLYHKNRLICRYKHGLGEVNKIYKNKLKNLQQTLIMFGFIEINEEFNVNVFKTAFVRDDVLQQIYHRLKFVEKYAQRRTKEQKRPRPLQQKLDKNEQRRKKFKPNEDDKEIQDKGHQIINID